MDTFRIDKIRERPLSRNNHRRCYVRGCISSAKSDPHISYHRLPTPGKYFIQFPNAFGKLERIDVHKAWKTVLRIDKPTNPTYGVCSLHFTKDDYFRTYNCNLWRLKPMAVPSINLPANKGPTKHLEKNNEPGSSNIQDEEVVNNRIDSEVTLKNILNLEKKFVRKKNISTESSFESLEATDHLSTEILIKSLTTNKSNNQSEIDNLGSGRVMYIYECMFRDIIKSETDLNICTGLDNFEMLSAIVKIVSEVGNSTFENDHIKTQVEDKIIMTYMMLKLNLSYEFLSQLFHSYTPQDCQRIIHKMIEILSASLSEAIYWPAKEESSKIIPKVFKTFKTVTLVLSTTEVYIKKPRSVSAQILCFSDNKGLFTVKFMMGFTPGGLISYVSEAYGGKATDSEMFIASNLAASVEKDQYIPTEKEISISEGIKNCNWRLIRPPSLSANMTVTEKKSTENVKMAKVLLEIEKVDTQIKGFKILQLVAPSLLPLLENIFTVICCTVNLSSPVMKDHAMNLLNIN